MKMKREDFPKTDQNSSWSGYSRFSCSSKNPERAAWSDRRRVLGLHLALMLDGESRGSARQLIERPEINAELQRALSYLLLQQRRSSSAHMDCMCWGRPLSCLHEDEQLLLCRLAEEAHGQNQTASVRQFGCLLGQVRRRRNDTHIILIT